MRVLIKDESLLAKLAAAKLKTASVAIVFNNIIHLHNITCQEFLSNKKWVCHELTHVLQYRKYGAVKFIILYLWESIKHGYYNNKFEKEARDNETKFELLDQFEIR